MTIPTPPPQPILAAKLFTYAAGMAFLLMGVLAGLAWFALDSQDDIEFRIIQFYSFGKKLFYTNIISYLVLLGMAAYIHRKRGQRRYYTFACALFLLYSYVGYGFLNGKLLAAYQAFELYKGPLAFNGYLGWLFSIAGILMAGVVFVGISLKRRRISLD